ncbi:unnamed protein product [Candida verbasci]|uniref:ferric-chelate reductase (NADPH) n=1 Tax=Candida verbasci TaxID=1227364 RepID=A0A9W4XEP7_9ASCO|nr:unnamed protein product [Candida verbasci]
MSTIPFDQQYFVEKDRNNKYEWLVFVLTVITLGIHGLLFHYIPMYLKRKGPDRNNRYFKFVRQWELWTSCVNFKGFYFQPSLVLLGIIFCGINVAFCFVGTKDLDYQVRYYIISKRISKVAMGSMPILLFSVIKNDVLTRLSGLQYDRIEFLHKWLSRWMWVMITVHLSVACYYWLSLNFLIMIIIPPQIFGFMAYGSFTLLNWVSLKFIREWAYDFFLVQHRVFAFIMLFMSFIHNAGNRAAVLIAVHGLVIDRVFAKIMAYIHAKKSPTKGKSTFELLDKDTILITIPVDTCNSKWYNKYSKWKAGQHIYLNVSKVKYFQYHPFTISSLAETGEMKILMRVQKGFTKKLYNHLSQVDDTVTMKVHFHGPYGAVHQPFLSFDAICFFGAGSGGAFTFPVCLDLVKQIEQREKQQDYLFRSRFPYIKLVWVIRHKENMIWFKHILDELIKYDVDIEIYVTQDPEEIDSEKSSLEKNTISVKSICSINYGRPPIEDTIQNLNQKSIAIASCGPKLFTNAVKTYCQKARKSKKNSDIYCYTESF